jgi:hypothetical protein
VGRPFGPLLTDATEWHPERPVSVSGISRDVRNGVVRWIMFDLDDPQTVTVYVYAVAEFSAIPPTATVTGSPS